MGIRGVFGFCVLAGIAAALVLAAGAAAGIPGTPTPTPTPTPSPTPTATPTPAVIPAGVTIGGVDVGGFAPADARYLVQESFAEPLQVVLGSRTLRVKPRTLGASARVASAVERALDAPAGASVRLSVSVDYARTRAWVRRAARSFDRAAVNAQVRLRGLHPFVSKEKAGRVLARHWATVALVNALEANSRTPVRLPFRTPAPRITRANFGPVIVIRRGEHRLWLYRGMRLWRTFGVAVGQTQWPTPLGRFEIVVKWRNPWWFPPNSSWARGSPPVPPGPSNPLGTRWMGLSAPGVGIHGTPHPDSIGYSASHGCIRMLIPQAEWLFNRVGVGTPVFIVPA